MISKLGPLIVEVVQYEPLEAERVKLTGSCCEVMGGGMLAPQRLFQAQHMYSTKTKRKSLEMKKDSGFIRPRAR